MSLIKEVEVAGKTIRFEFQKFAKQAHGSVMVSSGDTQVLVTVCAASEPKPGADFFPLTVDYVEKFYATGRIPGGFIKRETKPSERESLTARVIDRPLRPSFPKEYVCETQIICTVLSVDLENHPATLALLGASTALMISDIPFNGPVAAIRIGKKDGEYIFDHDLEDSDLDLNIAANPEAVLMVEAGAKFLSEKEMIDAIDHAHKLMTPLFEMQKEVQKEIGKPKRVIETEAIDAALWSRLETFATPLIKEAYGVKEKQERTAALRSLGPKIQAEINPDNDSEVAADLSGLISKLKYKVVRESILKDSVRIDGRKYEDIRPIACETAILKRTHGSALFTRGETQALAITTLGSNDDEQRLDTVLTPGQSKSFMLHYNFPPYSVGEARRVGPTGRREIGHGTLAEKALTPVLPSKDEFNYTIRLVSEILESNGSSSMASVCAGTMALLNAGVPIKEPVAGIAMGLIMEGSDYAVLSDILGDEDHLGDMDFKVTGTKEGITALQMDIKVGGLSRDILEKALNQAKDGRQHILGKMAECITTPDEMSDYAPRIFQMKVKEDKVRDIIGPGGKTIKSIVAEYGVKIDIEDSGIVNIVAPTNQQAETVKKLVRSITADPIVGDIMLGKVKRIMPFGAFVEFKPGAEGLLHISQLEDKRVDEVTDILNVGDQVMVKILDVDRQGKIKLSRKEALGKKPTVRA